MKTIQIQITKEKIALKSIAVLMLVLLLLLICMPYFQYGKKTSNYSLEDGASAVLLSNWVLQNDDGISDGIVSMVINDSKTMTVFRRTNGELIQESGKVSYRERTHTLKLTFADGSTQECEFNPGFSFNEIKTVSLFHYLFGLYDLDELKEEQSARYIEETNKEFNVNRMVIPLLIIPVLLIISFLLCLFNNQKTGWILSLVTSALSTMLLLFSWILQNGLSSAHITLIIAFASVFCITFVLALCFRRLLFSY